jgi:hypothetical protein
LIIASPTLVEKKEKNISSLITRGHEGEGEGGEGVRKKMFFSHKGVEKNHNIHMFFMMTISSSLITP